MLFNSLLEIIESPLKSFIASVTGTVLGYVPLVATRVTGDALPQSVSFLQQCVWIVTIILALTSIVTWIQKQWDRYKRKHKNEVSSDN